MKVYTYSEARQPFAAILESARREGAVSIHRKGGPGLPAERRRMSYEDAGRSSALTEECE